MCRWHGEKSFICKYLYTYIRIAMIIFISEYIYIYREREKKRGVHYMSCRYLVHRYILYIIYDLSYSGTYYVILIMYYIYIYTYIHYPLCMTHYILPIVWYQLAGRQPNISLSLSLSIHTYIYIYIQIYGCFSFNSL